MATIESRPRADGTTAWRVRYRLKPGANPTVDTFNTPEDAADFAALVDRLGGEAARRKRLAAASASRITLSDVLEDYIAQAPDITPGTASEYRRILDRSGIADTLGAVPVDLVDKRDVETWVRDRATRVTERTKAAPSPKTIRNEHGLLSTLLAHAVARGWCATNAAKGVRLPKARPAEKIIPTDAEYKKILKHISPTYRPLVITLAVTGLRWGEATALTWGDIVDGQPATIRVTKAWKHDGGSKRLLGVPKTNRGHRTIAVPQKLLDTLGTRGKRGDLVFTNTRGARVSYQTFYRDHWTKAIDAAEINPRPTIHSLRHYSASKLLAAGVPIHVVSRRLGHESVQITVDVYGHLSIDMADIGVTESAAILGIAP